MGLALEVVSAPSAAVAVTPSSDVRRYKANASQGVPAFRGPKVEGQALHSFKDGEELSVVDSLTNGWLRVLLPDGQPAFVSAAVVQLY